MRVKTVIDEDFTNYKKPSMFIGSNSCGGKCCLEAGLPTSICHNSAWRDRPVYEIDDNELCERYLRNPITQAIVFGGPEPFEQFEELYEFIRCLRADHNCGDDIVIYTGYDAPEIWGELKILANFPDVYVKFGRYKPGFEPHHDEVLGVNLASPNQYAEKISIE